LKLIAWLTDYTKRKYPRARSIKTRIETFTDPNAYPTPQKSASKIH